MRSLRYLNTVLTLIAVLLAMNLWTTWSTSELPAPSAVHAAGIPDAGAQRQEMIDLLKVLNQKVEILTGLFKSGQAQVRMEAMHRDKD